MDEKRRPAVEMINAMASRDRPALLGLLAEGVRLRAVLPARQVDLVGAEPVADEMLDWFAEVPEVVLLASDTDMVGDVLHAGYRFALRGGSVEKVAEQQAYLTVEGGRITTVRLICSGFRHAEPAPAGPAGADAGDAAAVPGAADPPAAPVADAAPEAARRLDALGQGCATLTPLIAGALREMAAGEVLSVLTDDPTAPQDIAAWSRLTGHALVARVPESGGTRFFLRHA
jgi:TusA-related sulfurtransferase